MQVSHTSRGSSSIITEETIAAVMDRLADEAHKVQAANPECKFPVGVSAKTMAALGWEGEYWDNLRVLKKRCRNMLLDRDFEVRTEGQDPDPV